MSLTSFASTSFAISSSKWAAWILRFSLSAINRDLPRRFLGIRLIWAMVGVLAVLTAPNIVRAQNVQYTNNTPDQTMRSSARIDPASHALSIQITLGNYPGRAGMNLPISITYSPKFKHIELDGDAEFNPGGLYYLYLVKDDERSSNGWTSSLAPPRIEGDAGGYDHVGQPGGIDHSISTIARIRVLLGDGSSHELRKDDEPRLAGTHPNAPYYSVDSSQLRFEGINGGSDSGTLFMPNGSRYIFVASQATQYIDTNGNTLTYDGTLNQWIDTLGRHFNALQFQPEEGDQEYALPGFNGSSLVYIFRWRYLHNPQTNETVLTNPNPDPNLRLYYAGNYNCGPYSNGFAAVSPSLFSDSNPRNPICSSEKYNPVVLSELVLPNGQSYRFTYNVWGEIDKMFFPTGGYERYQYAEIRPMTYMKRPFRPTNRGITDRWISEDGTSQSEVHWQYGIEFTPFIGDVYATTMTAPDGTLTRSYLHAQPDPYNNSVHLSFPYGFDDPRIGRAYDERVHSSNGQMLRRSLTAWTVSGPTSPGFYLAARNPRVTRQVEILLDTDETNALARTTTFSYDQDLNRISTVEHDYVELDVTAAENALIEAIDEGDVLRTTEVTYLVNDDTIDAGLRAQYRARNLLSLPTSTRLRDAGGNIVSQTSVSYDQTAFPLIMGGTPLGWADPGTLLRGNATSTGKWLYGTTYLETHAQYDQFGNVRKTWDANDTTLINPAQIEYSSSYQFAYPTTMTSSIPDPSGQHGSSAAFVTTTVYDATTGFVTSTTDPNNKTTTYGYADPQTGAVDPLGRIRTVSLPDGGLTTFIYNDNPGSLSVRTLTKLDATRNIDSWQSFDGLGRPTRTFLNLGEGNYNTTDTQYDSMGRVWKVSNPYISSGPESTPNLSGTWSTTEYDKLGRVIQVTTPDGAQVTTVYGVSTSNVRGQSVKVIDQAGKQRRSLTDALGRLVRVDEPNENGSLGDVTEPNQPTIYTYDVQGNLRRVEQGSQQRFFSYDSLGRLIRAKNPEQENFATDESSGFPALTDTTSGVSNSQWSMGYVYDANGNLIKRRDGRNIVTSYTYDALNRNTTVNYSNTTIGNPDVPDVTRAYDNPANGANGKGRLWKSYAGGTEADGISVEQTKVESYDVLGRPLVLQQHFKVNGTWSPNIYQTTRGYNLAGNVTSQTYPSIHTVNYNYDAAGRLGDKDAQHLAFSGNLGEGGAARTYSAGILYSSMGGMTQEQFGTDTAIYNKLAYNSRGQLPEIRVSTSPNDDSWNRGKLINDYSLQCSGALCNAIDNNGNLRKQHVYIPNNEQNTSSTSWYQKYDYDSLNRLQRVREFTGDTTLDWQQEYVYDRWGNRTIHQGNTGCGTQLDPCDINEKGFTVNTSNNRLVVPSGQNGTMAYDAAGNLTTDTHSASAVSRVYDAENRMTSETKANNVVAGSYSYNADGQRVRRTVNNGSAPVETWQIYGFDGELLAEYPAGGNVASPEKEYGYRNGQLLITAEPSSSTNTPAYNGSTADIPGTVQIENFDDGGEGSAYHDTTAGSHGQDYDQSPTNPTPSFRQPTDVDIYKWSGYSNGYLVLGHAGEWLNYTVSIATTGTYNMQAQVAWGGAAGSLGTFHVEVDGVDKTGPLQIPDTNWTFTTVSKSGVQLTAGVHVMRVVWDTNAGNGYVGDIDYLSFQAASGQSPYTGSPLPIPGTVETEYFDNGGEAVAYHDTTAGTHGQDYNNLPNFPPPAFRTTSDVDIYAHTGYSNGYLIVMQSAEWMKYAVNVTQAGTYTMQARVVWGGNAGGTFHVEVDGVDKTGPLQIPNTNWNFQMLTKAGVQLTAGTHMLRIVADSSDANGYTGDIDNLVFTLESASAQPSNIHWVVTDHLGTPRIIIDKTGSLAGIKRHDYLPFGEELKATQGARTVSMGYGADDTRQKFTSKERDDETGLDYFVARYFSSTQGRFTSADTVSGSGENPQTLNLYLYVKGNPLKFVDPTGHHAESGLGGDNDPCTAGTPLCSTHTDRAGNVVAVYNDKDSNVYKHSDLSKWNGRSKLPSKGKGVWYMGMTEYLDEFAKKDPSGNTIWTPADGAKIDFGQDWDETFWPLVKQAEGMWPWQVANQSRNGGVFDIKARKEGAHVGRKFRFIGNGSPIFMSARSFGNFLAGFNGANAEFFGARIDEYTMMNLAGALQQKQWKGARTFYDIARGKTFGPPPYYGEEEISGRRIHQGFVRGVQKVGW